MSAVFRLLQLPCLSVKAHSSFERTQLPNALSVVAGGKFSTSGGATINAGFASAFRKT
jgi:hypothetical protein